METQTLSPPTNTTEEQCNLHLYDRIPALDEAIAEIERGEVVTYGCFEDYLDDMHRDDDDEIHH